MTSVGDGIIDRIGDTTYWRTRSLRALGAVSSGEADMGYVGSDKIDESDSPFNREKVRKVSSLRFALLGRKGATLAELTADSKVVSPYPETAWQLIEELTGIESDNIIYSGGCSEAEIKLGFAKFGVDLVDSGNTVKAHELKIVADELRRIYLEKITL